MGRLSKTDVVIIGLGAAGGVAAHVLTQAGLNVVGIEAGPHWTTNDFVKRLDEVGEGFSYRNSMGGAKFNREIPTWRPNARSAEQPPLVVGMANGVGGSSIHYGAQSWRFLKDDFTVRSSTIARYGASAIPPGASVVDWPLTYDVLEPYYDKVEYAIGVSGQAGANPFEAPRSRPYPMPPLASAGFPKTVASTWSSLGYHPFPQPAAIASQSFDGRPGCTFCGFCGSGFGCYNASKSSTLVTTIPMAQKTGKLEIRANSRVMKINSDHGGHVTGVSYLDQHGKMQEQPASFVILAGYVFENTRMLLLSKSSAYKDGLSNNHGQVGKYYRAQVTTSVNGLFPGRALNLWGGSSGQTFCIDDLNGDAFDHTGLGFIRGGSIQAGTNNMPVAQSVVVPPDLPLWGATYKRWLHDNANSVGGVFAQMETLNYAANSIDLDPHKKDDKGVPVARLTFDVYDNEKKMSAYLTGKITAMLKAAGATTTWGGLGVVPVYSHAYGGTQMGTDPGSSVVNQYSISHEASNLAIMGASTFVTTTGYNPTTTLEALAWYGADYIAKNFNSLAA